ncbi:MAG: NAD(P)H-dependent oxidoreductase subunit E [Polyangia bacterium]|nr:NAD(P)H-dependent oxidoreductase subunit E [Polyangia bacterium]
MQETVDHIIDQYGGQEQHLLAVLQDIQGKFNYLPRPALEHVSRKMGVSLGRISYMATFFSSFSLKERGKHICTVCLGTACHVRGAPRLVEEMERVLEVKAGETTKDRQFTLETVNCVGACALGPLVIVDGEYHGNQSSAQIERLVKKVRMADGKE